MLCRLSIYKRSYRARPEFLDFPRQQQQRISEMKISLSFSIFGSKLFSLKLKFANCLLHCYFQCTF